MILISTDGRTWTSVHRSAGLLLMDIATICEGIPPLRQRQRDDSYNAPRVGFGQRNAPKSKQESIRQGHGNTYL